jgi:hypothetical protein
MKSVGPKGLLKSKKSKSKELINCQIANIRDKVIDTYVILGFGLDKIKKRIEYPNVYIIKNDLYESANHGYAFELILNQYNTKKYDGCIIINNGILFNNDIKNNLLNSDLTIPKIYYTNSNKADFPIGFTIIDSKVQHMFFNLTDNAWNEIIYIDNSSMLKYKTIYNQSMRNMFLFELINKSIDAGTLYHPVKTKNNSIIKISSIKDSNKIKETV